MEYDLDFLEACKALDEGRCEGIKCEGGCSYSKQKGQDVIVLYECPTGGIKITTKEFLGKWGLVGIKPVKRKAVIQDVTWFRTGVEGFTVHRPYGSPFNWSTLVDKPPMKMTLEWEE